MLDVFLNVILPTFLVAAIAALFQRWRKVPVAALSQVTLYLLTPSLIFIVLLQQDLPAGASFRIVGATVLATGSVVAVSLGLSKLLRHERSMQSAFILSTAFPNAGNLALPVLLLALGPEGLNVGVLVFLTQALAGQSLGIFVAARSQMAGLAPLKQIFKLPATYAIPTALVVRGAGIELPFTVLEPIKLLSQASIPVMLVILGLQIGTGVRLDQLTSLTSALVLRLLVAAPLAYVATVLAGLHGVGQQAIIMVSAMPVAVFTTILATEFRAHPKFVTNVVIASSLLSVLTLTAVITLVKSVLGSD